MADRIRHRALGGLGRILAVDVDAHAHLGDTAPACHAGFLATAWCRLTDAATRKHVWHHLGGDTFYAGTGTPFGATFGNGRNVIAMKKAPSPNAHEPI